MSSWDLEELSRQRGKRCGRLKYEIGVTVLYETDESSGREAQNESDSTRRINGRTCKHIIFI